MIIEKLGLYEPHSPQQMGSHPDSGHMVSYPGNFDQKIVII